MMKAFLLTILSSLATQKSLQTQLSFVADPWCPVTCSPRSGWNGYMVDVAKEAFGTAYKIQYETMSWSRAIEDTRAGKYSAIIGALKSDAPDFIFPSEPLGFQKTCFYVLKNSSWAYTDAKSLNGQTFGAVQDYSYGSPIDDHIKMNGKSAKLLTGTDVSVRLLRKLKEKEVTVVVEDAAVFSYTLKTYSDLKSTELKEVGCLKPAPLYIAFSPKNPDSRKLANLLSKQVRVMKTSGIYNQILSSYGIQ